MNGTDPDPPPGWYYPSGTSQWQWWNGSQWTIWRHHEFPDHSTLPPKMGWQPDPLTFAEDRLRWTITDGLNPRWSTWVCDTAAQSESCRWFPFPEPPNSQNGWYLDPIASPSNHAFLSRQPDPKTPTLLTSPLLQLRLWRHEHGWMDRCTSVGRSGGGDGWMFSRFAEDPWYSLHDMGEFTAPDWWKRFTARGPRLMLPKFRETTPPT